MTQEQLKTINPDLFIVMNKRISSFTTADSKEDAILSTQKHLADVVEKHTEASDQDTDVGRAEAQKLSEFVSGWKEVIEERKAAPIYNHKALWTLLLKELDQLPNVENLTDESNREFFANHGMSLEYVQGAKGHNLADAFGSFIFPTEGAITTDIEVAGDIDTSAAAD
jgi:hypothetical protein